MTLTEDRANLSDDRLSENIDDIDDSDNVVTADCCVATEPIVLSVAATNTDIMFSAVRSVAVQTIRIENDPKSPPSVEDASPASASKLAFPKALRKCRVLRHGGDVASSLVAAALFDYTV